MKVHLVAPNAHGNSARLFLDGEDVSGSVTSLEIKVSARDMNRLVVHYRCRELELDGDFTVEHRCPLAEES